MVAQPAGPHGRALDPGRAARLGRIWAQALASPGVVPVQRPVVVAVLHDLAADLLAAAVAPELDRAVPQRVGATLVDAQVTDPGVLERTLTLLGSELPALATDVSAERLLALLAAVADGYAEALKGRASTAAHGAAHPIGDDRFRTVFAEAVIGIGMTDIDGRILEVNHAMAAMLGYSEKALLGGRIWAFLHPADVPGLWDRIRELLAGARDHLRVEKAHRRPDGFEVWIAMLLSLVRDADGRPQYVVAMSQNITERHRLQTRLQHQALHDPLTGLPNRTMFFDRLGAELAAGGRTGVCYLDLDGFKAVNDTLGHDKGDALLQTVGRRLVDTLGADHLVARMGGDEFVVLVGGDLDGRALRLVARTALEAVRRPIGLGGTEVNITASIGVVQHDGGEDAGELMKAADTTLYWAKADGGDRFAVFDEERHRRDVDRFALSARMPEALARGEFGVEYQPLVRLADSRMIGVEALLRWTLPDGRRLDPSMFVPLAEDTGFIVRLGRWVLEQACRQAARWVADDPAARLFVSVNLAARQVRGPEIVDDVAAILADTGWPAEMLQLELTESAVMGTTGGSLAALHALADMGVRIAIDDFGTGYSNLAYLRRLPVHVLKLAGSFVTGTAPEGAARLPAAAHGPTADVDREVVGLLIRLAHTLKLTVTAESVETATQFAHLRGLGCDTGQGWYFAPPLLADAVPALVARPLGDPPRG